MGNLPSILMKGECLKYQSPLFCVLSKLILKNNSLLKLLMVKECINIEKN